jgi:hypothetical protein
MTSQNNPNKPAATDPGASSSVNAEDVLKPFQIASVKFLQAAAQARDAAMRDSVLARIDFCTQARTTEHDACQAIMAAMRKHVATTEPQAGNTDESFVVLTRAHVDYEKEVRQIQADTQAKLSAMAQKAFNEGQQEVARQFGKQRQDAYQTYVADLQQAWSTVKGLEPQTMNAIASTITSTLHAASQG